VVGGGKTLFSLLRAPLLSPLVKQKVVMFIASINKQDLVVLKELMEARKVTPVIDRCYALSEVPEALRYLEEGHARGKIVITVEHNNTA
ncbi:MAG TPA: zinc-binding dehydrogenase, partial [Pyrinomonadaceae bacterium]